MGQDLGSQFAALWQQVAHLHLKWRQYVELFGKRPQRIKILNKAAPAFFGLLQAILWEDILLHIARLTDSPGKGRTKKLTILSFPRLIADPTVKSAVQTAVDEAVSKTNFCRDWRNRHIAHLNLDLAIDTNAKQLESASRQLVGEALNAIVATLNELDGHFSKSETRFEISSNVGGALSLLHVVNDGLRAQAEREARLLRGEWHPKDSPRDI